MLSPAATELSTYCLVAACRFSVGSAFNVTVEPNVVAPVILAVPVTCSFSPVSVGFGVLDRMILPVSPLMRMRSSVSSRDPATITISCAPGETAPNLPDTRTKWLPVLIRYESLALIAE